MANENSHIIQEVERYYSKTIAQYGATPRGVDWNSSHSQNLRFSQCLKLLDLAAVPFTINDLGCGYGSLYQYLNMRNFEFSYFGVDVSKSMIAEANLLFGNNKNANFSVGDQFNIAADYTVASGIFNVKQNIDADTWFNYIISTINAVNTFSKKGFAFNCLTSYSDKELMVDNLYYANPCQLFNYCKRNFSKKITLLHDYELYEFTILVRKI